MFLRKVSSVVVFGFVMQMPLQAMDMERVNALADKIAAQIGKKESVLKTPSLISQKEVAISPKVDTTSRMSEESLGLRKTNLYSENETEPEVTQFTTAAPGTSKRFDRAYENAPPMIPHSMDGLLPITKANNACLGCHMPDVAPSMGATPIPPSHFASFRPITTLGVNGEVIKEGKAVVNTSDVKTVIHKLQRLSTARYNCSQCHAPQSKQEPLVKNTFQPDFISEDGAKKSHLIDTINEGVH